MYDEFHAEYWYAAVADITSEGLTPSNPGWKYEDRLCDGCACHRGQFRRLQYVTWSAAWSNCCCVRWAYRAVVFSDSWPST